MGVLARLSQLGTLGPAAYGLVALILLAEAVGVPSPDEAALFLAGVAVGRGDLSWPLTVAASAAGAVVGAAISYALARRLGRPLILHHGRRIGLTEERLSRVEAFLHRRGVWAAVLGRIISGVRLVIGYASGLFGMEPVPFFAASVAGALIWSMLDVTAGMVLGGHAGALERFALAHLWLAALALVVVASFVLWHRWRGRAPWRTR